MRWRASSRGPWKNDRRGPAGPHAARRSLRAAAASDDPRTLAPTCRAAANLTSVSDVRSLLDGLGVAPRRRWGQNFLVDANILRILIEAADLAGSDVVLEVGSGLGVLTAELAARAWRVIAIEKDARLAEFVREREPPANLELIRGDVLEFGVQNLLARGVTKVVSNLPFCVGTRVLVDLILAPRPPERIVATVQREVGARLTARPGGSEYGLLAVWAQSVYAVECLKVVRAACFWPRPEVDSAIVRLKRERALPEAPHERDVFLGLTKFAFSRRRKQMAVILRGMARDLDVVPARILEVLARLGVAGETRPEAVPVALWLEMAREFSAIPQGSGREPAARPDLGAVRERPRGLA